MALTQSSLSQNVFVFLLSHDHIGSDYEFHKNNIDTILWARNFNYQFIIISQTSLPKISSIVIAIITLPFLFISFFDSVCSVRLLMTFIDSWLILEQLMSTIRIYVLHFHIVYYYWLLHRYTYTAFRTLHLEHGSLIQ